MSTTLRVSLWFIQAPDAQFDEYVGNVVTCMTGNVSFPTPPVALADVTALQNTFRTALQAAAQGGTQLTAAKNAARDALEAAMRKLAGYVQITAEDLPTLLSSGFEPVSTNRSPAPLDAPVILTVVNAISGQMLVTLQAPVNARAVEIFTAATPGQWKHAITSTKSRNIPLDNLTPGTVYGIQARAVGADGYGPWSNPVSRMAI